MDSPRLTCQDADELAALYVLDALQPSDADAVSGHLRECPEAHPIFAELAATSSELLAAVEPMDTPPAMKARVMATIASTPQVPDVERPATVPAASATTLPATRPDAFEAPASTPQPAILDLPPTADDDPRGGGWLDRLKGGGSGARRDGWAWAGIAAGALVVVLVGVGILGAFRSSVEETDRLGLLRQAVAAAASTDSNVAVLGGEPDAGPYGYAVFPEDADGFIVIDGLGSPGADKAYQAWFLADGVPASAGLLMLGDDGLGTLTGLDPGAGTSVVAVTVEDAPGADAPTGDPILAGELRSATATIEGRLPL
jgi:anti-sigma-K factor RskA